jgi:hypothetical protein
MTWDMISAIATIAALLFTVFIEWPRFKERVRQSGNSISNSMMALALLSVLIGSIIVLIWMAFGPQQYLTLGRVGLFLTSIGFSILMIFMFVRGVRAKDFVMVFISTIFGIAGIVGASGILYSLIRV